MGDRIALLRDGKLVQVGTAEELYLRPADLFAAGFFSEINVFPGHVLSRAGGDAARKRCGRAPADGARVRIAVRLSGVAVSRGGGVDPRPDPVAAVSGRRRIAGTRRAGNRPAGACTNPGPGNSRWIARCHGFG